MQWSATAAVDSTEARVSVAEAFMEGAASIRMAAVSTVAEATLMEVAATVVATDVDNWYARI